MTGKDLVTWGILIWIGSEIAGQGSTDSNAVQHQKTGGECSYGFQSFMQSPVTAPYWVRMVKDAWKQPGWTFESE